MIKNYYRSVDNIEEKHILFRGCFCKTCYYQYLIFQGFVPPPRNLLLTTTLSRLRQKPTNLTRTKIRRRTRSPRRTGRKSRKPRSRRSTNYLLVFHLRSTKTDTKYESGSRNLPRLKNPPISTLARLDNDMFKLILSLHIYKI
jgi:hypothetical protein